MKSIMKFLLLIIMLGATAALAQKPPQFEHVIVIFQENRSTDNMFGSNPTFESGVDIITPNDPRISCHGTQQQMTSVPLAYCYDLDHWFASWQAMCNLDPKSGACKMDGACDVGYTPSSTCKVQGYPEYRYVDNSAHVIDPYFAIAKNYSFANYMFQTNEGPSMPAHQFILSGTSAPVPPNDKSGLGTWFVSDDPWGFSNLGCTAPKGDGIALADPSGQGGSTKTCYKKPKGDHCFGPPCYHHNTLGTVLDAANLTWRYFTPAVPGSPPIINAPLSSKDLCDPVKGVCKGTDYLTKVVVGNPAVIFNDMGLGPKKTCNLPNVTWLIPDFRWSDHPLQGNSWGPSWVADVIDAVAGYDNQGNQINNCGYWDNTAIIVTWDDWGGWYDHVAPQVIRDGKSWGSGYVYGFRVPMMVVSKYTPAGTISGPCNSDGTCTNNVPPHIHDFGSILRFIENNWGLGYVNPDPPYYADGNASDDNPSKGYYALGDFFSSQARSFTLIPAPANQNYTFFQAQRGSFAPDDDDEGPQ
jgi:phospholipase C